MSSCRKRYANERPGERVANNHVEPSGLGHVGPITAEPEPPQESYLDTPAHGEGLIEKKRPKRAARRGKRRRLARPAFDPARPAFAPKGGVQVDGEFYAGGEEIPADLRQDHAGPLSSLTNHKGQPAPVLTDASEARDATLVRPHPYRDKDENQLIPRVGRAKKPEYADPPLREPAALDRAIQASPRKKPRNPAAARALLPRTLADPDVLDDEEVMRLTPQATRELIGIFNQLRPLREYTVPAKVGLAKRGWYQSAAKALIHLFGSEAPRFAAVLAATSPRVSVKSNLRKALLIWEQYTRMKQVTGPHRQPTRQEVMEMLHSLKQKDVTVDWTAKKPKAVPVHANPLHELDVFASHDANIANALTADHNDLQGGVQILSGPKVHSFSQNVLGELARVTLDVWEARRSRISQDALSGNDKTYKGRKLGTYNAAYLALSAKNRLAAQQLTEERFAGEKPWEPAEVQETGWSFVRALAAIQGLSRKNAKEGHGDPLFALQALSSVTHQDIQGNADFASLLVNDRVCRKLARRLGLEPALDTIRSQLEEFGSQEADPAAGGAAASLSHPLDVAAAGAVAREAGRYQGGFLSGHSKLSRKKKPRRYAAPESAPQQAPAGPAQFAPQAEPQASVASTDSTDDSLSFAQAYQRAMSTEGQGWKKATEGVLQQLGITQHKSHIAIGDWEGSAEHSVLNILPGPPAPDKVRLAAAWYGLLGNQKAVLIFHHDPHGPDSTYQIEVPETDVNKVRQVLDHYGIKDRTVIPDKKGTKVVFTDFRREHRDKIASFAQHYNAVIHEAIGRGELIGGSTRTAARRAYREIIRAHEQGSAVAG